VQGDFPARESEAGDDTIGTPAFSGSLEDPRHGIGLAACSDIALFDAVR
jgi:hypothetical protein